MTKPLKQFENTVSAWPQISIHSHRFGGTEFRFAHAELGHLHPDGTLDIPFPRPIRDALLKNGLAEQHHWIPNSGWTTFRMGRHEDLAHALWLMRLSYLRYLLKSSTDPATLLDQENTALCLSPQFKSLFEKLASAHAVQPTPFIATS